MDTLFNRIRPSNLEANILYFIVEWRDKLCPDTALAHLKREFLLSTDQGKLRPVFEEMLRYMCREADLADWLSWQPPRFPLTGNDVTERWGVKGRALRPLLQGLRNAWVDSGCKATEEELMTTSMYDKLTNTPPEELLKEPLIPTKRQRK